MYLWFKYLVKGGMVRPNRPRLGGLPSMLWNAGGSLTNVFTIAFLLPQYLCFPMTIWSSFSFHESDHKAQRRNLDQWDNAPRTERYLPEGGESESKRSDSEILTLDHVIIRGYGHE